MNRLFISQAITVYRIEHLFRLLPQLRECRTIADVRRVFSTEREDFKTFLLTSKGSIMTAFSRERIESADLHQTPKRKLHPYTRLIQTQERLRKNQGISAFNERLHRHPARSHDQSLMVCTECEGAALELSSPRDSRTSRTLFRCPECVVPLHPPSSSNSKRERRCWENWHSRLRSELPPYKKPTFRTPSSSSSTNSILSTEDDDDLEERSFIVADDAEDSHLQLFDDDQEQGTSSSNAN
jgi:hypothetical protein